jgi:signal transduction histidine kinase
MQLKDNVLQSVIDEIITLAKDRVDLKNIILQVDQPADIINIYCDYDKLVIALQNILINAVEAIDHEGGRISIRLKKDSEHVIIEITDNGSGIEEDKIPRLFEPYYTSKRNGIGLGLASTLNIIQAHSGSIEVTSEVKKSTTFTVTLPFKTI